MTFEEFQATRKPCADLAEALSMDMGAPEGVKSIGNLYDECLFIEARADWWSKEGKAKGAWHLVLENGDWISDDLESLERLLYEWAESYR